MGKTRKTLDPDEAEAVRSIVRSFVRHHGSISNRQLREVAKISYDQCITIFGEMVEMGLLIRLGSGTGPKYELSR